MSENKTTYVAVKDQWGSGMSIALDSLEKAQQKVVNDLWFFPEGYVAVIENGVCIKNIEQKDFDEVYRLAANIIKAKTWFEAYDDIDHLMNWLDMDAEWIAADDMTAEDVIRKAGQKIGVELV